MLHITFVIGCYPLEPANSDRFLFNAATAAGWFTGSIAGAP
jgi:hypothetical protein